ncbi:hypothetical protein [Desulfosarcina sp. BuS5]|nr:hypothetical protein [Desulfosarcina sp. BuS5]
MNIKNLAKTFFLFSTQAGTIRWVAGMLLAQAALIATLVELL